MERVPVTKQQLSDWITAEIRKQPGCENISVVGSILPLAEPDPDGCNWSTTITFRVSGTHAQTCQPAVDRVVRAAYSRFNLAPDVDLALEKAGLVTRVRDANGIESVMATPRGREVLQRANAGEDVQREMAPVMEALAAG